MDANWWNNALASYDVGRQHRQDREYGEAYAEGGLSAVERAAGGMGDLQTATQIRRFQDDERQRAFERMEQIAPWARNLVHATRNMDPSRARKFLQQHQQRFLDFGFPPEQIAAGIAGLTSEDPEERAQWADTLDQAFQQHQDPDWSISPYTGQAQALTPDGQFITGGMSPDAERISEVAQIEIDNARRISRGIGLQSQGGGSSRGGYRILTPDEAEQLGLPAGPVYQMSPQGQVTRVGGSGGAGTDGQRVAAASALRMRTAETTLDRLQSVTPSAWANALEVAPIIGEQSAAGARTPEQRALDQASNQWAEAFLRATTGATITTDEVRRIERIFMPRPGDTPSDLARKREARRVAQDAIEMGLPDQAMMALEMAQGRTTGAPTSRGPLAPAAPSAPQADPLGIR